MAFDIFVGGGERDCGLLLLCATT